MCGEKAQAMARSRKNQFLVFKAQTERQKDLPLGIHAAVHPLLDAVNRSESYFCSSRNSWSYRFGGWNKSPERKLPAGSS